MWTIVNKVDMKAETIIKRKDTRFFVWCKYQATCETLHISLRFEISKSGF